MSGHLRAFSWIPCVAFLAAPGCDSALTPRTDPAGIYVLGSINGSPLPAVSVQNEWVTIEVRADTLRLFGDGRGEQTIIEHVVPNTPEPEQTRRSVHRFTYSLAGERIEIGFECVDVVIVHASCVAPPHAIGLETAVGLRLTDLLHDNETVYLRAEVPASD